MARQRLLWTTLPNGVAEDGGARVSVMLSPRLDPEADPPELSSFYPDWQDWPATLGGATFTVRYGAGEVTVPAGQTDGPSRIDTTLGAPDPGAWQALFAPELPVVARPFRDLSGHRVVSYDTAAVADLVSGLYAGLAAAAGDEMPTVSELLADPGWQEVVGAVAAIDRTYWSDDTGLRDPRRAFDDYRHGRRLGGREQTGKGRGSRAGSTVDTLADLQLFHTPPMKPKPVLDKPRSDDPRISASWLQYEHRDMPTEAELVAALDFHRVVAAMNQYPLLLRRLGLVVDLVLARDALADADEEKLRTDVDLPGLGVPTAPQVSPVTRARLQGSAFTAVSNPALAAGELRVEDGLLDLDPSRFDLLQADVDGAGLKVMNFARSLGRLAQGDKRVDPVTRQEDRPGVPSLRTAGLTLVHRGRGGALESRFTANAAKNQAAEALFQGQAAQPPNLWAEDLVRGFRVDAWDRTTARWLSLCRRAATYDLGPGELEITPEPVEDGEEGTVRLAATTSPDPASNPDLVWLHEALVAWPGWSLAAPPPGRTIRTDDTLDPPVADGEAEVPAGIPLVTRFAALPASLPRLRFGREYWLRARVVDLAGNSLPPREDDFGPEAPAQRARPYLRYEPVSPPSIALRRPEGGPTEAPAEGESMERIAIRSFNDTPDQNDDPTDQVARRIAVPPRSSVRDAEHHGMLDAGGAVDPATFQLLVDRDLHADEPGSSLQEEKIVTAGPLDPSPAESVYAVYREGQALTYLPDPLAGEVAVRVFGHPAIDPATVLTVPLHAQGSAWPDARPFEIRVFEDPNGGPPSYDAAAHALLVPLPKAVQAKVRLSMKTSRKALGTLGVWHWAQGQPLSDEQKERLEARALEGQHWMLTPWRTLEVVHAVQRPLVDPEIVKHVVDRSFGATHAAPRFVARCSIASTARLDLVAEWHEPLDDSGDSASAAGPADRARGDVAFSIKLTDPATYAGRPAGHARGGIPEHLVLADDAIGVGMPGHDLVERKRHEFGDTRYRRIEYRLDGTTRFREYLPAEILTDEVGGKRIPTEERIKVEGPRLVTWIPSSAPPPAPEVLYVVPTFGWDRTEDDRGDRTSWRRGGGLRVYLDRPWMASGYGEMLAVVLPPAGLDEDPEVFPKAHPYKKYVTQWANDPIWSSPFVPGLAPRRRDFPLARTAADPAGDWVPDGLPDDEKDQPPGPFQVTDLLPPDVPRDSGGVVEVAPHDVYFDPERRLWYCDVEVSPKSSYFPFLRLALARYQPVSVFGAHLSPVVLADFMQLAPDRWMHVNRTDDPAARRVVVYGRTAEDSSGRKEASELVVGGLPTQRPAEISGSTVVEVWVERLDPALGEDFGWRRVDAEVVPDDEDGGGGGPGLRFERFDPAERIVRARALHAERRFTAMASEGLIGAFARVDALWSGTVRLPAGAGPDARHRLVVAEYEEYLVDDDHPYHPPPEKKARRLVFVEHVELDAAG